MDKVQEIMKLVDAYAALVERSVKTGDACSKYLIDETESYRAIESKLRALLERKPLSEDAIETLIDRHAPPIHPDFNDDDGFEELVRSIERAHGIGA